MDFLLGCNCCVAGFFTRVELKNEMEKTNSELSKKDC
jgi:hypothetical protein